MTEFELAKWLFDYDPETGIITRRVSVSSRALRGQTITTKNTQGYLVTRFNGKLVYAHRLAYLWMTGEWPPKIMDHKNRNRQDNRWDNLRAVTYSENLHNKGEYSGVWWAGRDKVWVASIQIDGKKLYLGCSKDRAEAEAIYANKKQTLWPSLIS